MNCSPPGSSVHGISQARILEWDAVSFSRASYWEDTWKSKLFSFPVTWICSSLKFSNVHFSWEDVEPNKNFGQEWCCVHIHLLAPHRPKLWCLSICIHVVPSRGSGSFAPPALQCTAQGAIGRTSSHLFSSTQLQVPPPWLPSLDSHPWERNVDHVTIWLIITQLALIRQLLHGQQHPKTHGIQR